MINKLLISLFNLHTLKYSEILLLDLAVNRYSRGLKLLEDLQICRTVLDFGIYYDSSRGCRAESDFYGSAQLVLFVPLPVPNLSYLQLPMVLIASVNPIYNTYGFNVFTRSTTG